MRALLAGMVLASVANITTAAPIFVNADRALSLRFTLPGVPTLYTNDTVMLSFGGSVSGAVTSMSASLFDGAVLLGTDSASPPAPFEFYWKSPGSPFVLAATVVEFASIADATIDGRIVISGDAPWGFDDSQLSLTLGGAAIGHAAVRVDGGYGAALAEVNVIPVPIGGTLGHLAAGVLALALIAMRR